MAKSYVLSESDRKTLSRMLSWWRGGGPGKSSRPTPTRRRNYGGGGGGLAPKRALITGNVQAVSFDAAGKKISTGDSAGQSVATVMAWNGSGQLIADAEFSPMECLNVTSLSGVYATSTEPVALAGNVETIDGKEYFVLAPFDLFSLEGNELGSASVGQDDPDMKVPYKSGGERNYKVDSKDCSTGA